MGCANSGPSPLTLEQQQRLNAEHFRHTERLQSSGGN
jgi:hypothetical protein